MILTGSEAEHTRWEQECGQLSEPHTNILDLMGQLTLRELMAVIATSHVVVSGATGAGTHCGSLRRADSKYL